MATVKMSFISNLIGKELYKVLKDNAKPIVIHRTLKETISRALWI